MRLLALAAAVGLALRAAAAAPAGAFECATPKGWARADAPDGSARLTGPSSAEPRPLITIRFYPKGDKTFPDLDSFARRQTAPGTFRGSKPAKASELRVAGRVARRFERESSAFLPPRSLDSREIELRERAVAVPGKGGFYVLTAAGPAAADAPTRKAFERVLDSFKPRD